MTKIITKINNKALDDVATAMKALKDIFEMRNVITDPMVMNFINGVLEQFGGIDEDINTIFSIIIRMCELRIEGASDKEMEDKIVSEFGQETVAHLVMYY